MKKNSTPPTLEELLSSVEHAGRDARRQQQLSQMIERMAAEETAQKRRTIRLWSVRMVAAACLLLFVLTIVRLWQPMPHSVESQLAQAPEVQVPPVHMAPAEPAKAEPKPPVVARPTAVGTTNPMPALPSQPFATEPILEEIIPSPVFDVPQTSEQYAEAVEEALPTEEEVPVASVQPEASDAIAQSEPTPTPKASEQHRSLFRLRQAEPSLMDGNVLALQIF
jgi:hypothetical protein